MLNRLAQAIRDPQRLRNAISRRISGAIPFRLGPIDEHPGLQITHLPDRFFYNYERYRATGKAVTAQSALAFLAGHPGDMTRYYMLAMVCDRIEKEKLRGDIAELGVHKGNTAFLLAELARRIGSKAYLFDTFESLPDRDLVGIDQDYKDRQMNFANTSIFEVKRLVGSDQVEFVAGYFPDSATPASQNARYALVHLDCDLYAPTLAGLEFFYPRLVSGGFLVVHDYSSLFWDGVEHAIDEFFADKPEKLVPIPDKAGSIVIRKH